MAGVFETEIKIFFHLGESSEEEDELDEHLGPDGCKELPAKTEVAEESNVFSVPADENKEHCLSPKNGYEAKNFKPEPGTQLFLNENTVSIYKTEISEGQRYEPDVHFVSDEYKELMITKTEVVEECNELDVKLCEENQKRLGDTPENDKKFQCKECDYITNDRLNFTRHATAHWDHKKLFKCKTCDESFWWRTQLWEHVKTHDVKSFPCPYCSSSYCRKVALNQHIFKKHKGSQRLKCDKCSFTCPTDVLMKRHMMAKHTKKLKCAHCSYSSAYEKNMRKHLWAHTKANKFECDSCKFTTLYRSCLERHKLVKHSGRVKKHVCDDCTYSTHIKEHLAKHIKRMHYNMK